MDKWLKEYERRRTNPFESNTEWYSSKFDIVGLSWAQISEIYVDELDMKWGPACSALKKNWYNYKWAAREGRYRGDSAYRIVTIQKALGIPVSEFPNDENHRSAEWENEMTSDEIEAKKDELNEGEWDIEAGAEDPDEDEEDGEDETWEGW